MDGSSPDIEAEVDGSRLDIEAEVGGSRADIKGEVDGSSNDGAMTLWLPTSDHSAIHHATSCLVPRASNSQVPLVVVVRTICKKW